MLLPLVIPPLSLDLVGQVSLSSCHIPDTVPRARKEVNTAGKRMIGVEQQNFVPVSGSSQGVVRMVSQFPHGRHDFAFGKMPLLWKVACAGSPGPGVKPEQWFHLCRGLAM